MNDRKNIVVNYSPFALEQTVYCWVNGDCVEQHKCKLADVFEEVVNLKRKYQVHKINLVGPEKMLEHFKNEFMNTEYYTQNFLDCSIEITDR